MTDLTSIGSKVLYRSASGAERALADVEGERLMSINAELIIENWDPYLTKPEHLRHLAYGYGVRLWEDSWSIDTKRNWVANHFNFLSQIGTLAAFDTALAPSGFNLVQEVVPPQGFYLSPNMTKEEWDGWIRLMPQIRIKFAKRVGNGGGELFIGEGCIGDGCVGPDLGRAIYGREAVIRYADGREQDLLLSELNVVVEGKTTVYDERIHLPGKSSDGLFIGADFVGASYLNAEEVEARIVTVSIDHAYNHRTSTLTLNSFEPGLEPIDARYERNSDIGDGSKFFFIGDFFTAGELFVTDNLEAQRMLADRIYLHDPEVAVPMTLGLSFLGADRLGIEPNTARLLVDAHRQEKGVELFVNDGYIGDKFLLEHDDELEDRALRSINVSKALRDQIFVSFATDRPVLGGDIIDALHPLNDPIPNSI